MFNKLKYRFASVLAVALSMIGMASATITTDMANFTEIIGNASSGFTGMVVGMLGIFMTPPLLYFVVLGIFVTIIHIAAGLLMKRGKR